MKWQRRRILDARNQAKRIPHHNHLQCNVWDQCFPAEERVEHALIVQGYHQSKEEQRDRVENNQAVEDMHVYNLSPFPNGIFGLRCQIIWPISYVPSSSVCVQFGEEDCDFSPRGEFWIWQPAKNYIKTPRLFNGQYILDFIY